MVYIQRNYTELHVALTLSMSGTSLPHVIEWCLGTDVVVPSYKKSMLWLFSAECAERLALQYQICFICNKWTSGPMRNRYSKSRRVFGRYVYFKLDDTHPLLLYCISVSSRFSTGPLPRGCPTKIMFACLPRNFFISGDRHFTLPGPDSVFPFRRLLSLPSTLRPSRYNAILSSAFCLHIFYLHGLSIYFNLYSLPVADWV
jgi:hypothetical protein